MGRISGAFDKEIALWYDQGQIQGVAIGPGSGWRKWAGLHGANRLALPITTILWAYDN